MKTSRLHALDFPKGPRFDLVCYQAATLRQLGLKAEVVLVQEGVEYRARLVVEEDDGETGRQSRGPIL